MQPRCIKCKCVLGRNNKSGYCTEHGKKIAKERFYKRHPGYSTEKSREWWRRQSLNKKKIISGRKNEALSRIKHYIVRDLNRFDVIKARLEQTKKRCYVLKHNNYRQKIKNMEMMLESIRDRIMMNRAIYEDMKAEQAKRRWGNAAIRQNNVEKRVSQNI